MVYWIEFIKDRIKKNKNFLGFISGPTGSGKSWTCMSIAERLDPEFDISRVVFNARQFMKLVQDPKIKSGNVIVFEEMGVSMSNKSWQSLTNKMLNFCFQTFRHRNFIVLMNSPYMDFVDASTRKLFHAELRTVSIDLGTCQVKLKPRLIQYNSRYQKFYYKRLRMVVNRKTIPIKDWLVDKPSEKLILDYEKAKTNFTTKLFSTIETQLNKENIDKISLPPIKCPHCGNISERRKLQPRVCQHCKSWWVYKDKMVIYPYKAQRTPPENLEVETKHIVNCSSAFTGAATAPKKPTSIPLPTQF